MKKTSRRLFLQNSLTTLGVLSVAAACDGGGEPTPPPAAPAPTPAPAPAPAPAPEPEPAAPSAPAADANRVNPEDPLAKGLSYVEDISGVDPKPAAFKAESNCANCQLFQGKEGEEWGPCTIFQMKNVAAKGWCASWAPKA